MDIRESELAAVQTAVNEICKHHAEEDILRALSHQCKTLANEIEAEDNNHDAAFYWKTLHERLQDVLKMTCK